MLRFLLLRPLRRKAAKALCDILVQCDVQNQIEMMLDEGTPITREGQIIADSIKLMRTTVNPRTFFARCEDIAVMEERVMGIPSEFTADGELMTLMQTELIDRIVSGGRPLDIMEPYLDRLTEDALRHYRAVTDAAG